MIEAIKENLKKGCLSWEMAQNSHFIIVTLMSVEI